jgi:hypothetical protein
LITGEVKTQAEAVRSFISTCKNTSYSKTIDSMYTESANSYKGHLIRTYKTVDGFDLDLHIFLPDTAYQKTKSRLSFILVAVVGPREHQSGPFMIVQIFRKKAGSLCQLNTELRIDTKQHLLRQLKMQEAP